MLKNRVDILIQVSGSIDRLYKILGILMALDRPKNVYFNLALLFVNPWLVEEYCKKQWKQFEKVKIYLSDAEEHNIDHIYNYCKQTRSKNFYNIEDSTLIEDDFYFTVCDKLGIKWKK